jgi:magnesium-transporting ATPase (P-type)
MNAILPWSNTFKELNSSADSLAILFLIISSAWTCFVMVYIIKKSEWNGWKIGLTLIGIIFFVQYFMTQIETLFFGSAFEALTTGDVLIILLAGLVPLLVTVPLAIKFFKNEKEVKKAKETNETLQKVANGKLILKLVLIGFIYMAVYFIFGYYVAWQFTELRIFYSGSAVLVSFIDQLIVNFNTNSFIFLFQIFRGILFGAAGVPLLMMFKNNKKYFITSLSLLYLCTAIVLIVPNVLFPDTVRFAHLIEMTSSMLIFALITGFILSK